MAAEIFEMHMGDSFKSLRFIKHWKAARDEGEDKGEEATFLRGGAKLDNSRRAGRGVKIFLIHSPA